MLAKVKTPAGLLLVGTKNLKRSLTPGQQVSLAIRPERIELGPDHGSAVPSAQANGFAARLEDVIYGGPETCYRLKAGGMAISAVVLNSHPAARQFRIGDSVCCRFAPESLVVLED